jgi:hypothetical protein
MAVTANKKKPVNPTINPNLIFPFFKKIEPRELPEIFVNKIITLTIIEALISMSIKNPFIVSAGKFTKKSKNNAREAMKKANKIYQYCFSDGLERKMTDIIKNIIESERVYSSTNSCLIVENGKISKPEREGKLIPQTKNNRNKT